MQAAAMADDPTSVISGEVRPPATFLTAEEILQRPGEGIALAEQIDKTETKLKKAIGMWLDRGGENRSKAGRRVALGGRPGRL